MISPEQKELADFIKEVHLSLRRRTQEIGAENAWREHLENEKVLRKYAECMKELSENYWSVNNISEGEILLCRNVWMANFVLNYFQNGGLEKEMEKELKKMKIYFERNLITNDDLKCFNHFKCEYVVKPPYKVLDVGSCHNPLKKFDFLNVYAIDLYPASEEVKKCNFINASIETPRNESWFDLDEIISIPSEFFDVVVFSLYLEYLPSPTLRYSSCEKAYKSLKANGLLLIVTPDSKHATANAHIMKNWKIAAASIGFKRIQLEKLKYLYCMAFRKSISSKYPRITAGIGDEDFNSDEMFIIPQDSVDYSVKTSSGKFEKDEKTVTETFAELPFS